MGLMHPHTESALDRAARFPRKRQARFATQPRAVHSLGSSLRLESAPYPTEMAAFEAFERQSKQRGFEFGFVDSESRVVVTYYRPQPESKP